MKLYLLAAGGAALSLALAAPAVAQVQASGFTQGNVDPADPFGEIDINLAEMDMDAVPAYLASVAPEVRLEIEQRCVVITANTQAYDTAAITFCTAVLAAVQAEGAPTTPAPAPAAPAP